MDKGVDEENTMKKKRVVAVVVLITALCLIIGLCPLPRRINSTLSGTLTMEDPAQTKIPVSVSFDGYLLRYLLRQPAFKETLSIRETLSGNELFVRKITGYKTALAEEMTGILTPLRDVYIASGPVYDPGINAMVSFEYKITKDFSVFLVPSNDLFGGSIVASSDPSLDLQKLEEQFDGVEEKIKFSLVFKSRRPHFSIVILRFPDFIEKPRKPL